MPSAHHSETAAWDVLAGRVDQLIAAWEDASQPPALLQFAPAGGHPLERVALVELVKVDLEYRWRGRRWPKLIEEYVADFPQLAAAGSIPCDLIYEEYHIRRQVGDAVETQEFFERFPQQAAELGRLLGLESPHATTTLVATERAAQLDVGHQVDDFDLLTMLGRGAFATVYLARQRSMQRLVALKVSADRGCEPQTMAQLDHPHIVRVYDQRRLADRRLRLLYMQHVPGGTLRDVALRHAALPAAARSGASYLRTIDEALDRRGESPPIGSPLRHKLENARWPTVVCWLGARLAAALDYAHQRGVFHRDIKPANILVAADGSPKLADFNTSFSSKLDGAAPAAYFGGSLAYMSPEQLDACNPSHPCQPHELDARSDLYSLGIVLWELLAGARPFAEELDENWSRMLTTMADSRRQGLSAELLARLPADLPSGLAEVLRRCLAPELAERYTSAAELARDLELCLQPRAQQLLHQPRKSLADWITRRPACSLAAAALVPNLAMSGLNIAYNQAEIVRTLSLQDQRTFFSLLLALVNGAVYTVGVALGLGLAWPLVRALRGEPPPDDAPPLVRARCLKLGDFAARIVLALWAITGVVFPAAMQAGGQSLVGPAHYGHFLTSQVLSGLISATLTFFLVTSLCVRWFYPRLLAPAAAQGEEVRELVALGRRTWVYFGLAVSVPFLAVTVVVLVSSGQLAIAALGGIGVVAFLVSFWLALTIRGDLATLAMIISPAGETLGSLGESTDSFWTGSR